VNALASGAARTGRTRPTIPRRASFYIPSNENHCNTLKGKVEERVPGQWWAGVAIPELHFSVDTKAPFFGEIQAIEVNIGKRVWRNLYSSSMMWGSLLTTAGGRHYAQIPKCGARHPQCVNSTTRLSRAH